MVHQFKPIFADQWKPDKPGDSVEGEIFTLGTKMINTELVPYMELLRPTGEIIEVLLSVASLTAIWNTGKLEEGGYIAIRYDGLSKHIEKAGNKMKTFSVCYYAPGAWEADKEGNFKDGVPLKLNPNSTIGYEDTGKSDNNETPF